MKTSFLLVFLACVRFANAQDAAPALEKAPLPEGPLIQKRAPEFSKWIIQQPPKAQDEVKTGVEQKTSTASKVSMTKTGKTILRQTWDNKNQIWETWCMGLLQITIWPNGKQWTVGSPPPDPSFPDPLYQDYSHTDFPGFEWISKANFAGIEDLAGTKCMVFKDRIKPYADEKTIMDYTAYINLETRLPVAIKNGSGMHTYQFGLPPSTMLATPQLVSDLIKNLKTNADSATRKEIKPF